MMTIDNQTCPHDIATLLKEFLRDLPDPLLCHSLYVAFIKTQSEYINLLQGLYCD